MDFMEMYAQMTIVAKAVAFVLIIMSMWSLGVGIERFFTYQQARNQSKLYAPQVAKHLKEGRLKEAVALSQKKEFRYSHLAKVVLAGLQEYQFQQESGITVEVLRSGDAGDKVWVEVEENGQAQRGSLAWK